MLLVSGIEKESLNDLIGSAEIVKFIFAKVFVGSITSQIIVGKSITNF